MTKVRADFNNMARGGLVVVPLDRVSTLSIGATVTLFDSGDDTEYSATLSEIDSATGRAYFAAEWEPSPDEAPITQTTNVWFWKSIPTLAGSFEFRGRSAISAGFSPAPVH
jgi:hypothetical protein